MTHALDLQATQFAKINNKTADLKLHDFTVCTFNNNNDKYYQSAIMRL